MVVDVVADRASAQAGVERLMGDRGWASLACPPSLCWPAVAEARRQEAAGAPLGLCEARWGVAETGTLVVVNRGEVARGYSLLPPAIGLFVAESAIASTLGDVLRAVDEESGELPACLSFISGVSATADIVSVRVAGVHGPGEVFVWVISAAG